MPSAGIKIAKVANYYNISVNNILALQINKTRLNFVTSASEKVVNTHDQTSKYLLFVSKEGKSLFLKISHSAEILSISQEFRSKNDVKYSISSTGCKQHHNSNNFLQFFRSFRAFYYLNDIFEDFTGKKIFKSITNSIR